VAFKKLETGLSILVIPITFFALMTPFKFSNNLKQVFMKTFIGSTTVFSIFSFTYIILRKSSLDYIWSTDKYRNIIIDIPLIGHHPIYASIFLALSVIFVFYLFKQKQLKNYKEILLFLTLTLINLVLLLFLSSKGAILALFIIIFFLLLLTSINKTYKYLIIVTFVFSLLTLFIYNRRMNELVSAQTYEKFNPTLSTSVRLGIYDCSWAIIKKQLLAGYGVGDAQRELNFCYANKSDILLMHRFNSHNQYMDITIKTGLIGLLIFLGFLIANFLKAIKKKNQLLIMILALYCMLFLVENVLSRQSGVILFFFLICFFQNANPISTKK
jgi:O-antigen ligase